MKRARILRFASVVTVFALAVMLVVVALGGFATPSKAAPQLVIYTGTQIFAARGVTQTVTGTAQYLQTYTGDCYANLTLTGTQTVTLSLQHSPDAATWINMAPFPAATNTTTTQSITTFFSPTLAFYGSYIRAIATIAMTTAPVNVTLLCTYR